MREKTWVHEGENPPVGLILCAQKNEVVERYALEGLPNKVMAWEYRTALPDEKELAAEIRVISVVLPAPNIITYSGEECRLFRRLSERLLQGFLTYCDRMEFD
jgi:hypothetical protein